MKLISYTKSQEPSWGIALDDGIVDIGRRANGAIPDLKSFLTAGSPQAQLDVGTKPNFGFDEVNLLPVVPNPDKIVMAALNYHEDGEDPDKLPNYPVLFLRLPSSQIADGDPLIQPRDSERLDFEGELAVIIGKAGRHIQREQAMSHVAGYSIYNDGSVRDWQRHSHQFTPGKNFTGTGAFGPWMVQASDLRVEDRGYSLVTKVNGVEKQRTDTSRMIFDIPYLIAYISTFAPLEPGDVIVTGTCTGFGATRRPQEFLKPGDRVDVTIDGIGTLSNTVKAEA
jgi:2-keto-4-pentenoate hydratase/2-oxohepta-3-ene-1,7-dioic acid hydratase in catechol pathway